MENLKKLSFFGLPIINNLDDFSLQTHLSKRFLYNISIYSEKHYKTYSIPKKTVGIRIISQPSRSLKGIQSWILVNILDKIKVSKSCKGFEKGSSIIENVKPHIGANTIVSLDIKDFYPSITDKQIFNVFKTIGYNNLVSTIFTNICSYKGKLPQGSPCSPKLANLITWHLDLRISGFIGKKGIIYTRYADDLTFSGSNPQTLSKSINYLRYIIKDEGFAVNESKTRIAGITKSKKITGLVLSDESYGIGSSKYKKIRALIRKLTFINEQTNYKEFNYLKGYLSYLKNVDFVRYKKAKLYIEKLQIKFPNTLIDKLF